ALAHKADELPLIIELVSKEKDMSSATPIILVINTSLESQLIISR
ncbi:serine/threonine-phosphatase domain protein, partial [Escherichia coli DEC4D]